MSASSGSGGVKSDINVTPLVDVVLVLLIIFLVTMPIILRDLVLEIPRKLEDPEVVEKEPSLVLDVSSTGTLLLGGVEVTKFDLTAKLVEQIKNKREPVIFVGFEDDVKYGDAVVIMDLVKGAGKGAGKEVKVALKMKEEKREGEAGSEQPAQ
jgi:biopolymer transport protein ExbD